MPDPAKPSLPAADLADELTCARLFATGKVVARLAEPMSGAGGCRIAAPISLQAVILAPGRRVGFEPPVTVGCAVADALADWVRGDLAPLFAAKGRTLVALSGTSGYSCRPRNQVTGAKLSEHGLGRAVDLGAFVFERGAPVGVRDPDAALLGEVKRTACARFATVLGPGSDGFHETHLHVDVEPRRNNGRICHWDGPLPPS